MSAKHTPVMIGEYQPQGCCPNPWLAVVDGVALRTSAGGLRRFKTERAAVKAARAAITKATGDA